MMNDSAFDLTGILDRCRTGIAEIFQQSRVVTERANGLAALLHELLPVASLTACFLQGEECHFLAIRSGSKGLDSNGEEALRSHLTSLNPLNSRVQLLPAEALTGLQSLVSAIQEGEQSWGFLLIALPPEASTEDRECAAAILTVAAPTVALRWMVEGLQREQAELKRFALVGQAFAGLAHDLNNALNSMMLQTSVVQLRVDSQIRQELAAIRQHGAQAAGLVRSLQHVVQERREHASAIDLNSVLAELLSEEAELRRRFLPRFGAERPRLHSTRSAVKQLVRLLLEGVGAATTAVVNVETGMTESGITLELRIANSSMNGEVGSSAIETLLWQNLDEIGRLAGQSLLRQLGGTVMIEHEADGTPILRVNWRPSA